MFWQQQGAGKLARASDIGASGGKATLPKDLVLRDGETVIVAEVLFRYEPWLLGLVPETHAPPRRLLPPPAGHAAQPRLSLVPAAAGSELDAELALDALRGTGA